MSERERRAVSEKLAPVGQTAVTSCGQSGRPYQDPLVPLQGSGQLLQLLNDGFKRGAHPINRNQSQHVDQEFFEGLCQITTSMGETEITDSVNRNQ